MMSWMIINPYWNILVGMLFDLSQWYDVVWSQNILDTLLTIITTMPLKNLTLFLPISSQLITTQEEVSNNHHQILFTLRVNPRNTHSLLNTVVLVHVPPHVDGASAQVSSVGRSIGRGELDTTQWNEMTRILSWKLGELYSGAVCEFEVIFSPLGSTGNNDDDVPSLAHEVKEKKLSSSSSSSQNATMFPVLLRYDCEGSLLSDVDLDWSGRNTPVIKRRFRVYHREV